MMLGVLEWIYEFVCKRFSETKQSVENEHRERERERVVVKDYKHFQVLEMEIK